MRRLPSGLKQLGGVLVHDERAMKNPRLPDVETFAARPRPIPTVRNCIYHVYASTRNDLWERNVNQLLKRIALFNGRRVVAIAYGQDDIVPFDQVAQRFAGQGFEILKILNCRELREVASFRSLLESVASLDPEAATFYAHTKANSTNDDPLGAKRWAHLMYDKLLRPEVPELLAEWSAVGTHKMQWPRGTCFQFPSMLQRGQYMFAGTFFWFRHDRVFAHPQWRDIPHDRYGAEAWLAGFIPPEECHSVWQPPGFDRYPTSSPYNPSHYPEHYDDF